jgi:hypothetical protein
MTTSGERAIESEYREAMNRIAAFLDDTFKGSGFTLLVFQLNSTDGRMNYISNAGRAEMITAMKEFIANNEGRAHDAPESKQ